MNKNAPTIFVSWFPLYHGLAFMKHIWAVFYAKQVSPFEKIDVSGILQEDAEEIFYNHKEGYMFDKVFILTPSDEVYKQITSKSVGWRREDYYLNDEVLKAEKLSKIGKEVFRQNLSIDEEIKYLEQKYPGKVQLWKRLLWRTVNHYPPSEQIWWFHNISNLPQEYKDRVEFIIINSKQLTYPRDYEKITHLTFKRFSEIAAKHKRYNFVINTGLTTTAFTIAWFTLATANILPEHHKFIEAYDIKQSRPNHRMQKFYIKEVKSNLLSDIVSKIRIYNKPLSKIRKIAQYKFETYLKQGFAILLLGERGVGKSHIANFYASKVLTDKGKFVAVNCASFIDSHIAESELFGYKKGAFTGANEDKTGLIEEANGGVLFMDEIHTLPKDIQFKLMRAFATDEENKMTIRRLGDTKERKITLKALILASNRKIEELKETLLPDFFDRIAQLIIELPPLRETPEEIPNAFKQIWEQLRFNEFFSYEEFPGKDSQLQNWIQNLPLYGNYRDLQRIAMNYKAYLEFPSDLKKMLPERNAFEYAKKQYELYMKQLSVPKNEYFSEEKTPEQMLTEFRSDLAQWAIKRFGSAQKAAKHFEQLGETISAVTLYNWKNKINSRKKIAKKSK